MSIAGALRRRWIVLFACASAGCALAVAYWRYTPPTYESSSQVLLMRKDTQLSAASSPSPPASSKSEISEDLLSTHMQIIQSPQIVGVALERAGLMELPTIVEKLDDRKTPVEYVIEHLHVTRGGKGQAKGAHVLNIAFRHTSDVDAQRVVLAVVQHYKEFLKQQFQDVNQEAATLIDRARNDLEEELKQSEQEYVDSRTNAPLLWNGDTSTNIPRARFEQIQTELSDLRSRVAEATSRLAVVEEEIIRQDAEGANLLDRLALIDEKNMARMGVFATMRGGVANTAAFQALQPDRLEGARTEYSALLTLLTQERTLLKDFGPNHPEVVSTRQQIETVQQFLEERKLTTKVSEMEEAFVDPHKLAAAYLTLLRNDLESLRRRETELVTAAAKEELAAKALVSYEMRDQTIREQIKRKQDLYGAVVERLREINLARDYGGFVHEIIAPASVGQIAWPNLTMCLAMGMLGGLFLGAGATVVLELRDRSFHSALDVHETLNLPVLAQIPRLQRRGGFLIDNGISSEIHVHHFPESSDAEVFRSLRTTLFFAAKNQQLEILQCTSPVQGDGKSTTIANLAASIAQAGRRVLLVDADLRRPRVHSIFGLPNKVGLSNVLVGECEPWDAVQQTECENLSVMTCGDLPANPAELLQSPQLQQLMDLVRQYFDFVLVDSAPVLAVSDPCIIAPCVDATILLVRASKDARPQALQARDRLTSVGANVIGSIINVWNSVATFSYGGYSEYGHGYGGNGAYYRSQPERQQVANGRHHQSNGAAATSEGR